ncbi:MAG: hypothetical protein A3E83_03360 [Gammaproteobacteria bacterium RIFCSPHIGHO2_12_FULL_41_20]|nr:MAG: hypothetical protein A3E83_03360 [Gammaproteobacteria bacterium RIFCSPHIGHO2_12_FULL_41_20]
MGFVHPRHWPSWLSIGIVYITSYLPYHWQVVIGCYIGKLAYWVMPGRRHIAKVNLHLCFPELTAEQRQQLLKQNFAEMGVSIVEMGLAYWGKDDYLQRLVNIEGKEHLDAALQKGKGVILLCAHFITMDMVARLVGKRYGIWGVYRPQKKLLFDRFLFRLRSRALSGLLHRKDIRAIVQCLKQNYPIYYAADQDYGLRHSVFSAFFNIPAATITAGFRLAKLSGAAIVPVFHYRLPRAQGYQIVFHPALENVSEEESLTDSLARTNRLIEDAIRICPEQYLWVHRRFKTRPDGAPGFY